MTLAVRFTDEAIDDLEAIEIYIGRDSRDAAARVIVRVRRLIDTLADFPYLGKLGEVQDTHKIPISGSPYVVVYEVHEAQLWILRVYHGARDLKY